ncbi:hypothetical protein OGY07_12945 [Citrobacter sp. Cs237]|uniref:hypothetical protein n=1 Tax=Citrobacter sp. Cs237 TaxID=2985156 RepID=UPI002575D26D|nr:hypothetical protein [Citrobacter sp. Cs237]EHG7613706.1 hypothetical protein [Citrobacter sedlakii]MDM2750240.1 hypothetical protein [Citrobacter sp. Cs237]HBU8852276.1 hypothetical protein [Citrobacter sedlakii]
MARKTKPLTDTEIKAAKPKDADYQLYDGDGFTLLIKSRVTDAPIWLYHGFTASADC